MGRQESVAELLRRLPDLNVGHADANSITGIFEPALREERVPQRGVLAVALREEAARGETVVDDVDREGREGLEPSITAIENAMVQLNGRLVSIGVEIAFEDDIVLAWDGNRTERAQIDVTSRGRGNDLYDAQNGRQGVDGQIHEGLRER
jgi:hypothetical protein